LDELALRVQLKLPLASSSSSNTANLWCMWKGASSRRTAMPCAASRTMSLPSSKRLSLSLMTRTRTPRLWAATSSSLRRSSAIV
jgi:hypothetical protein